MSRRERQGRPGGESPAVDLLVLTVYLALLLVLGGFALWESRRAMRDLPIRTGWIAGWKVPPLTNLPGLGDGRVSVALVSWFGLAVGFLSGLLGMSGDSSFSPD